MKLMAFSGVFVLASAGLVLASDQVAGEVAPLKPEGAALVSVAATDAAIRDKKADLPEGVTLAGADCAGVDAPPICGDGQTKN